MMKATRCYIVFMVQCVSCWWWKILRKLIQSSTYFAAAHNGYQTYYRDTDWGDPCHKLNKVTASETQDSVTTKNLLMTIVINKTKDITNIQLKHNDEQLHQLFYGKQHGLLWEEKCTVIIQLQHAMHYKKCILVSLWWRVIMAVDINPSRYAEVPHDTLRWSYHVVTWPNISHAVGYSAVLTSSKKSKL